MGSGEDKLPLPLEGIRVLDVTHIVAGPYCSVILGDMGAEVIKIERPGTGERGRSNGPFVQGPDEQQVSARFLGINRNKKSITLDLRDPRCKEALLNMVRVSDVLLDNWGPGALRRLGLGYDVLQEAYQHALDDITDDASLVERLGNPVRVFTGSEENIKITTQVELHLAEVILRSRADS